MIFKLVLMNSNLKQDMTNNLDDTWDLNNKKDQINNNKLVNNVNTKEILDRKPTKDLFDEILDYHEEIKTKKVVEIVKPVIQKPVAKKPIVNTKNKKKLVLDKRNYREYDYSEEYDEEDYDEYY
jgi:hypothetical protein